MTFDRRHFLRGSLGLAMLSATGRIGLASSPDTSRKLAPVDVRRERIIRTVVGHRPFRASGFRVEAQRLDDKTVIHNYGHGGAGITLSWGTSQLAVDLAWQGETRDFAVLGCGAVGLATARLLQQRGGNVTIYARDLPPHTTSNIAGGQWAPAFVADPAQRTDRWNRQLANAAQISHRAFQDLLGEQYGVRWMENYYLSEQPPTHREGTGAAALGLFPEAVEAQLLRPQASPFRGYFARRFVTMMIEPALYLHQLMQDVVLLGGRIKVQDFDEIGSLQALPQKMIMNCTGLGSRELFGDRGLIPIKGQLTVLLPQPEVDYAVVAGDIYMFARRDGVLLGGTHETGVESNEPNFEAESAILAHHAQLFSCLK